jgi:hypothetical protein
MPESEKETAKFSRRLLLRNIAIGAPAVAALTVVSVRSAAADGKLPKSQARYQPGPNGDRRCASCVHFASPTSCDIVDGDVSPQGWCQFYGQKA